MFKLQANPTFAAPVPLTVPGLPEPLVVTIIFRHKNRASLKAWMQGGVGKDAAALLHELIVDWSGVQGPDGEVVPYSLTALATLLGDYWPAMDEITDAYLRELKESKTKNSVRLPAA